jgi:hypothetical protein
MNAESVEGLKREIHELVIMPMRDRVADGRRLGVHSRRWEKGIRPKTIALGTTKTKGRKRQFRITIRIQHPQLVNAPEIEKIRDMARGAVDVRYIGQVRALQGPWYEAPCRPLKIGCSIGHFLVTAGSLGAFVRDRDTGTVQVLSSNHILANLNTAQLNDDIIQPGNYDNGLDPADLVASFTRCFQIDFQQPNVIDCAIASIGGAIGIDSSSLDSLGTLAGVRATPLVGGERVRKVGRTTGVTSGTVLSTAINNLEVDYSTQSATFDSQIEIQGENGLFSDGGDSGSLVVDENNYAVGLLCSGSDQPSSCGQLSYANPIETVLNALRVDLIT